jgi:lipoprotein-releasing system permease protein
MIKPFELFVGLRYTRAKRRNHFISVVSAFSILGIAIGVIALIVVLSVMNGFQNEVRNRILGMSAHLIVYEHFGGMKQWQSVVDQAKTHPQVTGAAPFIRGEGLLTFSQQSEGVLVRGVIPELEKDVSIVEENISLGSFDSLLPGSFNIVLGEELANALGVGLGDKVMLITPNAEAGPMGVMPRLKRFTVTGTFAVGMHEYDSGIAYIHMDDADKLYRSNGEVNGVRLETVDMYQAPDIGQQVSELLQGNYFISDWTYRHANFFRALKTEKTMVGIMLLMIIAVAAFNIVSTLVMIVTDKQGDIAILRTLGASPAQVMRVFMIQGSVNGVLGTTVGAILGIITALNLENIVQMLERTFNFEVLPSSVYYINELPSDLNWNEVIVIIASSLLISILATLYPARRAAKTQPAEALRYE